jgi:hypothetical protein
MVAVAFSFAIGSGCTEDAKPPYIQAQYDVTYLGSTETLVMIGKLENNHSADYRGFCSAVDRDGQLQIRVSVSQQDNTNAIVFDELRWTDGAGGCVSCNSVEITYENNVADDIPCCGDGDGLCTVQVQRGEPKHSVEIYFECENVDTNTSSGGVPVPITVRSGRMLIENCPGM